MLLSSIHLEHYKIILKDKLFEFGLIRNCLNLIQKVNKLNLNN